MSLHRIRRFLAEHAPPTPCLVVDTGAVTARVREFATEFPHHGLYYAVKANPEPAVLRAVLADRWEPEQGFHMPGFQPATKPEPASNRVQRIPVQWRGEES